MSERSTQRSWSPLIEERYQCSLADDLVSWFDSEIWRAPIHGEFTCALHPEELLKPAPEIIWPGLMAADLLPLVGNHYGDWICIRMNESNRLEEVVYWYHGGGDCLQLAAGLSEAILFSHYLNLDPMEFSNQAIDSLESNLTHPNETRMSQSSRDLLPLRWAAEQQKLNLEDLPDPSLPRDEIIEALLDLKIAVIALMCLRAKDALRHWPRQRFDQIWTEDPMDRSGCISRYLFDQDSVPPALIDQLSEMTGESHYQGWDVAAQCASLVTQVSPDQAWSWHLVGYSSEKRGLIPEAIECYRRAMHCSTFSDQATRFSSHWTEPQAAKFSVARLTELDASFVGSSDYVRALCHRDPKRRREEVTAYWMACGKAETQKGCLSNGVAAFYAAGWDVGAKSMASYQDVLSSLIEASQCCGQMARSELASTHLRCLLDW